MKKSLICAVALAFMCTVGLAGMSMSETDKGPADITIEDPGSAKPKPAIFPHGQDDAGKQTPYAEGMKIEKCATCHTGDVLDPAKYKGKTAIQRAGHGNCQVCHKAEAKKDEAKKALKKCTTCHPKKKK